LTSVLSFDVAADGAPAPCWDYDPGCPVYRIPGSARGGQARLLTTWRTALEGFRNPALRDLSAVDPDYAIGGVTRQHRDGLLRRSPPQTDVRTVLNPIFARAAVAHWQPSIAALARAHLPAGSRRADLASDFVEPLVRDVVRLTTGLGAGEWDRLRELSARAAGPVYSPHEHDSIDCAWQQGYEFCERIIGRVRRHPEPTLIAQTVAAMDGYRMPAAETVHASATVLGGFPSVLPALTVLVHEALRYPDVLDWCRADPGLVPKAVWEHLRHSVHFPFGLPGAATRTVRVGDIIIPAGTVVLPVIRAAHRDPGHTPDPDVFDVRRRRQAILTFGAGVHVCPGKALTLIVMEEALRALSELRPRLIAEVTWRAGLMPVPNTTPIERQA
jgi:cytochrome P450